MNDDRALQFGVDIFAPITLTLSDADITAKPYRVGQIEQTWTDRGGENVQTRLTLEPAETTDMVSEAVEFPWADITLRYYQYVVFQSVPRVRNLDQKTISFWVYWLRTGSFLALSDFLGDGGTGEYWRIDSDSVANIKFHSLRGTAQNWVSADGVIPDNQWVHIAVVWDRTLLSTDPTVYLDGTPIAMTHSGSYPSLPYNSGGDTHLYVGGSPIAAWKSAIGGQLYDVRIYDTLLSADDVADLADEIPIAAEPVFHALYVDDVADADFDGKTLTQKDYLFDIAGHAVGVPFKNPIGRHR
jgi:hypothetical protein